MPAPSLLDDELRAARRRIDEIAGRAAAIVACADAHTEPHLGVDAERRLTTSEASARHVTQAFTDPHGATESSELCQLKQLHDERVSKVRVCVSSLTRRKP